MSVETFVHDPDAELDYGLDWSDWLERADDTISTSTWSEATGDLTLSSTTHAGGITEVWVSGGREGVTYTITNKVVTTAGRTDERSITLKARER